MSGTGYTSLTAQGTSSNTNSLFNFLEILKNQTTGRKIIAYNEFPDSVTAIFTFKAEIGFFDAADVNKIFDTITLAPSSFAEFQDLRAAVSTGQHILYFADYDPFTNNVQVSNSDALKVDLVAYNGVSEPRLPINTQDDVPVNIAQYNGVLVPLSGIPVDVKNSDIAVNLTKYRNISAPSNFPVALNSLVNQPIDAGVGLPIEIKTVVAPVPTNLEQVYSVNLTDGKVPTKFDAPPIQKVDIQAVFGTELTEAVVPVSDASTTQRDINIKQVGGQTIDPGMLPAQIFAENPSGTILPIGGTGVPRLALNSTLLLDDGDGELHPVLGPETAAGGTCTIASSGYLNDGNNNVRPAIGAQVAGGAGPMLLQGQLPYVTSRSGARVPMAGHDGMDGALRAAPHVVMSVPLNGDINGDLHTVAGNAWATGGGYALQTAAGQGAYNTNGSFVGYDVPAVDSTLTPFGERYVQHSVAYGNYEGARVPAQAYDANGKLNVQV